MKLSELYRKRRPGLSFEIYPPKRDTYLKDIEPTVEILADCRPDFISITFGAGGSAADDRTLETAKLIREKYHTEPVVHLTCLHYRRADIDRYAERLKESGIDNVLALRGDPAAGAEPAGDFRYASDLVAYLKDKYELGVCAGCYPEGHVEAESLAADIANLKRKVDAGTDFLISQLFLDNEIFYRFLEQCQTAGIDVPIIPGVMPVINKGQMERMASLCGATIHPRFRRILDRYGESREALFDAGMAYMMSQVTELIANGTGGGHLYTMNRPEVARRLSDGIRNLF